MATENPNTPNVSILPDLAAIARCGIAAPEVEAARRKALRESVAQRGMDRRIYVWPHQQNLYVLDGIELFLAANDLGLVAGRDYEVIEVPLADLKAAQKWRYERAVTTQREVPLYLRCQQAVELFREDAKLWRQQARINQRKGGKKLRVSEEDKVDSLLFFAMKANVSRSTMGRIMTVYKEAHRDPNAEDDRHRRVVGAETLASIIEELNRGNMPPKTAAENVKNERQRRLRIERNSEGAKEASQDFVCDSDFDSSKLSQIICGDSLELLERWAELPSDQRPQPTIIFGSPPYWIPNRTDSRKEDGKGAINYGSNFLAMLDKYGIKTWDDYVEILLRRYIAAAYKLLPRGGRLIFQVDNTRGRDANKNLIVFWHTDEIRRLGRLQGFIPSSEIIWRKSEISGRKQGIGSPNCPTIRPNHEYVIVLRKDCNEIKGNMEFRNADLNSYAISSWDESNLENLSAVDRAVLTSEVWDIGAARSNCHAATFPKELPRRVIRLFAPLDSVVLDPWNGTGTTCAMALVTGRRFIGIDIEPSNCEIATKKVQAAKKELPKIAQAADAELRRLIA